MFSLKVFARVNVSSQPFLLVLSGCFSSTSAAPDWPAPPRHSSASNRPSSNWRQCETLHTKHPGPGTLVATMPGHFYRSEVEKEAGRKNSDASNLLPPWIFIFLPPFFVPLQLSAELIRNWQSRCVQKKRRKKKSDPRQNMMDYYRALFSS